MEKNIWMKPDFELELFVPNNYIAACCPTATGQGIDGGVVVGNVAHQILSNLDDGSWNIWIDSNGNGVVDGGSFVNGSWVADEYGDQLISKSQVPADSNQGIGNKKCHAFSFEPGYPTYLAQLKGGGTVWRFYRARVYPSGPGSGNMHYTLREDTFVQGGNNS